MGRGSCGREERKKRNREAERERYTHSRQWRQGRVPNKTVYVCVGGARACTKKKRGTAPALRKMKQCPGRRVSVERADVRAAAWRATISFDTYKCTREYAALCVFVFLFADVGPHTRVVALRRLFPLGASSVLGALRPGTMHVRQREQTKKQVREGWCMRQSVFPAGALPAEDVQQIQEGKGRGTRTVRGGAVPNDKPRKI